MANLADTRRRALVTGAGKNIGAAVARRLAESGHDLVLHVRVEDTAVRELRDELVGVGAQATVVAGELRDPDALRRLEEAARGCDIVVNNVAVRPITPFLETTTEHWHEVFDINLHVPVRLARAALPHMINEEWGRIVSLIGVRAQQGAARRASSSSAKHALIGLTRSLANEFGPQGVTVNAVSPGTIEIDRDRESGRLHTRTGLSPLGRFGTPDDIARMVDFLVADASGYITGQVVGVNGGELMLN